MQLNCKLKDRGRELVWVRVAGAVQTEGLPCLNKHLTLPVRFQAFRATHIQDHHAYTNAFLEPEPLDGVDNDGEILLELFSSPASFVLFPVVRALLNLTLYAASPPLFLAAKLITFAWCTVRATFQAEFEGTPQTSAAAYKTAAAAARMVSLAAIAACARWGGWPLAQVFAVMSIAKCTLGYANSPAMFFATHFSMKTLAHGSPGFDHVLRQLTASNDFSTSSPAWTYFFNALNLQTAHHLFPQLPWQQLKPATQCIEGVASRRAGPGARVPYNAFRGYWDILWSAAMATRHLPALLKAPPPAAVQLVMPVVRAELDWPLC